MLGKTFTVDPISKRRLDNMGEEDQFYIHEHHEPIISEEVFEKAQEILNQRNKNRGKIGDDKREKYSRKYASSCMLAREDYSVDTKKRYVEYFVLGTFSSISSSKERAKNSEIKSLKTISMFLW
ncbi:recombinase [Clostridium tetanomorphum DSM 665]|nr:recombinase [Clostridium tetanomorphum DSM 665]SQC00847.1 site-specific recombinase, DNA invertase Pin [Clostridium tetanomorphum]